MRARCQGLAIEAFMIALAADAPSAIVGGSAQAQVTIDVTNATNSGITKSVSLGSSPRGSAVTTMPNAITE